MPLLWPLNSRKKLWAFTSENLQFVLCAFETQIFFKASVQLPPKSKFVKHGGHPFETNTLSEQMLDRFTLRKLWLTWFMSLFCTRSASTDKLRGEQAGKNLCSRAERTKSEWEWPCDDTPIGSSSSSCLHGLLMKVCPVARHKLLEIIKIRESTISFGKTNQQA